MYLNAEEVKDFSGCSADLYLSKIDFQLSICSRLKR